MKKSTKILISVLSSLLIVCLFFVLFYESNSGLQDEILFPWETYIGLKGTDYVLYYLSLWQGKLADYPWVIQISYLIIITCCFAVSILFFIMAWNFVLRKKSNRLYLTLYNKYYEALLSIAKARNVMTENEIYAIIRPDLIKETSYSYNIKWIELFIALRADIEFGDIAIKNLQTTFNLTGLTNFMEERLTSGKESDKLKVLQAARVLNMQLANNAMSQLVNSRYLPLRKAARFYYILTNEDDPYLFFEEKESREDFLTWDEIELHQLFEDCKKLGKNLPSFLPLIRQISDPQRIAFFIKETAYWGSTAEMSYLTEYFDSPVPEFRQAAFEGMGIRKFAEAEEAMCDRYYSQPETLRRIILKSILEIDSGKAVPFFRDAFLNSASRFTKRTALLCLWKYSKEGKEVFMQLKEQALEHEQILFNHVEKVSGIVNYAADYE